jgi:hypothetical protein
MVRQIPIFLAELFGFRPQVGPVSYTLWLATLFLVWLPLAGFSIEVAARPFPSIGPAGSANYRALSTVVFAVVACVVTIGKVYPPRLVRLLAVAALLGIVLLRVAA